jgi:hypothetical protein
MFFSIFTNLIGIRKLSLVNKIKPQVNLKRKPKIKKKKNFFEATPPCPEETRHSLRMMYGIGLRAKIWNEFVKRFKVNKTDFK